MKLMIIYDLACIKKGQNWIEKKDFGVKSERVFTVCRYGHHNNE